MTSGSRLRKMLHDPEILVVPGGGSPLELRLIEQAGFSAGYISGYATAAARFGLPDIGLIAYGEVEDMVRAVSQVTSLPLIVDCDTGYGDVANVARTVRGMESLGVAAVQIEDQSWPKRCGHMDGRIVEPADIAVRKIDAAVAARRTDMCVIARTDSADAHGIDEAIRRLMFRQAGADVVFVDGPKSIDELKLVAREVPGPIMANMSESGKTPIMPAADLQALGYAIVIFPSSAVRLYAKVIGDFMKDLKRTGDSRAWIDRMATLDETNALLGLSESRDFDRAMIAKRA